MGRWGEKEEQERLLSVQTGSPLWGLNSSSFFCCFRELLGKMMRQSLLRHFFLLDKNQTMFFNVNFLKMQTYLNVGHSGTFKFFQVTLQKLGDKENWTETWMSPMQSCWKMTNSIHSDAIKMSSRGKMVPRNFDTYILSN